MQFDPTANYSSNYAFESRREISVEINREKSKLVTTKTVNKKEKCSDGGEDKVKGIENIVDDSNRDSPDVESSNEIILKVDPFVSDLHRHFYRIFPYDSHARTFTDLRSVRRCTLQYFEPFEQRRH